MSFQNPAMFNSANFTRLCSSLRFKLSWVKHYCCSWAALNQWQHDNTFWNFGNIWFQPMLTSVKPILISKIHDHVPRFQKETKMLVIFQCAMFCFILFPYVFFFSDHMWSPPVRAGGGTHGPHLTLEEQLSHVQTAGGAREPCHSSNHLLVTAKFSILWSFTT